MNGFNVQGTDLVEALEGFLLRIYGHRTSEILVLVHYMYMFMQQKGSASAQTRRKSVTPKTRTH